MAGESHVDRRFPADESNEWLDGTLSERDRLQIRLHRLTHTDALTGLANRASFCAAIAKALEAKGRALLLLIDLDGLKPVNEEFGHVAGDDVLVQTASRLSRYERHDILVARLGGDQFALLASGSADPLAADALARAVLGDLELPFVVGRTPVHMAARIGIALAPTHGRTVDLLLTSADLALDRAKANGRNTTVFFTPTLRSEALNRVKIAGELREALERDQFTLHYQPQVRLSDGALVGAEALLRWRHPEHGLLTPGSFLSALERHPVADQVGMWVLGTACAQTARWRAVAPDFRIAVNLFAAQFRDHRLADGVAGVLDRTGLPAGNLDLEVTETIALREDEACMSGLRSLQELGVQLALDDFGTGYASLSALKLPLHRLKIDRRFVGGLGESRQDAAVVRAIIHLGRTFGLAVLAEGIETQQQRDCLLAKGCTEGQGYLFGEPMPPDRFAARLGLVAGGSASVTRRIGSSSRGSSPVP